MADPLGPMIARFHADGRPRVWSLIVTIMGDAVLHRGGEIETAALLDLANRIGIGNSAVRTALSRLASEGWLDARRAGRVSHYRLTERAEAETRSASALIYAPRRKAGPWLAGSGPMPPGALGTEAAWWAQDQDVPPGAIIVRGQPQGRWSDFAERHLDAAHRGAIAALECDLADLPNDPGPPLQAMAARTLLLHRWRRLVLRFPDIPPFDGTPDLRNAVGSSYCTLWPASELWLGPGSQPLNRF